MALKTSWRQILKRAAIAALLFELVYVGAALIFLNGGMLKRLINAKPRELQLTYDYAYSLFPGRVQVKNLGFRITDNSVQLYFEIDKVTVGVDTWRLPERIFHTHYVRAENVKFFLRTTRVPEVLAKTDLKALPPIPGFAEPLREPPAPRTKPYNPWKLWLQGIAIGSLNELWIEEFRYRGKLAISGGFFLHPQTAVRVEPSVLTFHEGILEIGNVLTLLHTKGRLAATVKEFDAKGVKGLEVFRNVTSDTVLTSEVENLEFINYYLKKVTWLRLGKGKGSMEVALKVEEGNVREGSHFRSDTHGLTARLGRQQVEGTGEINWTVNQAKSQSELRLSLSHYRLAHDRNAQHFIHGEKVTIGAEAHNLDLTHPFQEVGISVDLPDAQITHLGYFNAFLPKTSRLEFVGGQGRVDAQFRSHPGGKDDQGTFSFRTTAAQLHYRDKLVSGELLATAKFDRSHLAGGKVHVADATVSIRNFFSGDRGKQPPWAAEVSLLDSALDFKHLPKVDAHLEIKGDNARPIYAFLQAESNGGIPSWLPSVVPFTKLIFRSHVMFSDGEIRAEPVDLSANNSHLTGWFRKTSSGNVGRFLFVAEPIAAAVEFEGDHTRLRLQDASAWFKLREKESPRTALQ